MDLLIAPVSGGRFPHQMAAVRRLLRHGYKPEIMMGCSGGNITAYLTSAAHWDILHIDRIANSITSEYFVRPWFPGIIGIMTPMIASLFLKAAYRGSTKIQDLFCSYFTPSTVTDVEIWNGAVNRKTGSICLFCNRDFEPSLIKGRFLCRRMFKMEPLRYLKGNVEDICRSSVASSSVPFVVGPQLIGDSYYIDGGTKIASPLAPLQDEIRQLSAERGGVHIVYINGFDIEKDRSQAEPHERNGENIVEYTQSITDHIAMGIILHDRMTAYEIIHDRCSIAPHYADVGVLALDEVISKVRDSSDSLLEIYPLDGSILDYTNFNGSDLLSMMERSEKLLAGRVWWNGDRDLFKGIEGVHLSAPVEGCPGYLLCRADVFH